MTEHRFKKLKKKHLFIIVASAIVLVGILAFVLAYGISDGWDAVGRWFGSSDAVLLYIFLGVYGIVVAYLLISERIKKL